MRLSELRKQIHEIEVNGGKYIVDGFYAKYINKTGDDLWFYDIFGDIHIFKKEKK